MVHLTTPRLILRDYEPQDLAAHHALMSDRAVMRYLMDLYCKTEADARRNLALAMQEAALPPEKRRLWFFRMGLRDGTPLGSIGYTVTAHTPGGAVAEAGYFIARPFWGRGYTTEALREVLRFAFEAGGVHRLSAGCNANNRGSEGVMRRCGMVLEAVHRDFGWHEGAFYDRLLYRLLRPEWQALWANS